MFNINISGNITNDAILKTVNGKDVISFTVAVNDRYRTAAGELRETVTFVSCNIWNQPKVLPLFFKGRGVSLSGNLTIKNKEDRVYLNLSVFKHQVFGKGKPQIQEQPLYTSIPETLETVTDLPF